MSSKSCINLFLLLCSVFFVGSAFCDEPIPVQKAIEILKNMENGISTFRWTGELKSGKYTDKDNIDGTFTKSERFSRYSLLVDVKRKAYLTDQQSITPWVDGDASFISALNKCAFDGKTYQELDNTKPGKALPTSNELGRGVISKDLNQSPLNASLLENFFRWEGLGIGVPLFIFDDDILDGNVQKPEFISVYLSKVRSLGHKISVTDTEDGVLKITIEYPRQLKVGTDLVESPICKKFDIDMKKGGIITHFAGSFVWKDEMILGGEYQVETQKNKLGQWVPTVVKQVIYINNSIRTFTYSEFEINPKVSSSDFNFTFPDGTSVDDLVAKRYYKVGDIADEDRAIDEFIQRHGLTGNVPEKSISRKMLRYILIATGIILIGIALFRIVRKRREG